MINTIWFFMIVLSIVFAITNGNIDALNKEMFASLQSSLDLCLGLLASMMLWCGTLKVAEKSGLVKKIGMVIKPVIGFVFKDIPEKGDALGAIVMNITSNMFGLGNAATPLGLKAMAELQKYNDRKTRASNSMIRFLVINSAPVCILPSTVISIRASLGSKNPGIIILPSIISSTIAISLGLFFCYVIEKRGKV